MDETRRRGERAQRLDPGSSEARARVLTARLRAATPCEWCDARGRVYRVVEAPGSFHAGIWHAPSTSIKFQENPCPACEETRRPCLCDAQATKGCHECGETGDPTRGLVELLAYAGDPEALQVVGHVSRPHQVLDHNDAPYVIRMTLAQAARLDSQDWTRGLQRWGPGPMARVLLTRAREAARLEDRRAHYQDCPAQGPIVDQACPTCLAVVPVRRGRETGRARTQVIERFEQWANDPTPETAQAIPRDSQTHQASEAWWRQLGWFAQGHQDLQMVRFMIEASDEVSLSPRALDKLSREAVAHYAGTRLGL